MCVDNKACVIFLQGELGAGKTTLVRGFLQACGVEGKIKSPTYTLIETYEGSSVNMVHMDLYRLNHPNEMDNLNIRDYLDDKTILLIEWPEKALAKLPSPDLSCQLDFSPQGRKITVKFHTPKGQSIVEALQKR